MSTDPNSQSWQGSTSDQRRIGDAERDEAVELLRQHMADGRLDYPEFDERLGRAMTARTQPELNALFTDLPTPHPRAMSGSSPMSAFDAQTVRDAWTSSPPVGGGLQSWQQPASLAPRARTPRPWWTHWGIFAVAFVLTMMNGRLGMLIPIAAAWVWWLGPKIAREQEQKRQLEEQEHQRQLGRWDR